MQLRTTMYYLRSRDGLFSLVETSGVGMANTPWKGLSVISSGIAKEHVVEIRLNILGFPDFNGTPVTYSYRGAYVVHGMRSQIDTLEDTQEYIDVLQSALKFAYEVQDYIDSHPEWSN